ncbi:MAG: hypothetical protein GC137_02695 [Alphaproteobacteria bacterium]|nr:hypothetical protein [Alphaproteobacteria bacterium]
MAEESRFSKVAHKIVKKIIGEVESGNSYRLHTLFDLVHNAHQRVLYGGAKLNDDVFASYLIQTFRLADERGVDLMAEREKMREKLIQEADAGDRKALAALAEAYEEGRYGIEVDPSKAVNYMLKAAEAGDIISIRTLHRRLEELLENQFTVEYEHEQPTLGQYLHQREFEMTDKGRILENQQRIRELYQACEGKSQEDYDDGEWMYIPDGMS